MSYKTAAFRDRDGSLGGGPNSYVLIHDGVNDSIAVDAQACEIKPAWNAAVCKGDIGRLTFAAPGGPFGGGGLGGARGAGPGGAGGAGPGAAGPAAAAGPRGPAAGGAAGPGAFGGGAGGPPAQPPVVLSRNGKDYTVAASNVRAGTEIKVATERSSLPLNVTELDRGSWVIFQLPGFTTAASGTEQSSLDALRQASDTAYFKDTDALWVKVVSAGDAGNGAPGGGTVVQVSR
jgi:hypothetical protein